MWVAITDLTGAYKRAGDLLRDVSFTVDVALFYAKIFYRSNAVQTIPLNIENLKNGSLFSPPFPKLFRKIFRSL